MNRFGVRWVAAGALSLALVLPTGSWAQADGQSSARTDGQIEMDVVHALDAVPQLKDDWITAGTVGSVVTLSGTSASAENRTMAEQTAAQVPGVSKVVNNLQVGSPQGQQQGNDNQQAQPAPPVAPGQAPEVPQAAPPVPQAAAPQDAPAESAASAPSASIPRPPLPNGQRPVYQPRPSRVPPQSGQNAQQQPSAPAQPEGPRESVTIDAGQLLKLRTAESLNSRRAKDGEVVEFTVVRDVYAAGVLAIPRGATIRGQVVDVKKGGALAGSGELALKLSTLEMEGRSYPLDADQFSVKGPNKAGHTVSNALGGALMGALIGGAVGGGRGAAIGAAAGGAGGTAASAASGDAQVWIPAESLIAFHLNSPLTVTPVSAAEAQRLATGLAPAPGQQPTLYRRRNPYGYPPPPPPPNQY